MKRILTLLLCLAMLISAAGVGASASYHESHAVAGSSATVDGVNYTVVSTAAQLNSALTNGGNIMLANNIVWTSSTAVEIPAGTLLDGNGYTITYSEVRSDELFHFAASASTTVGANVTTTIRNLTFGSPAAHIQTSGTLGLFSQAFYSNTKNSNCSLVWENVNFYVTNSGGGDGAGAVFTSISGYQEFSGCTLTVNLSSSGNLVGGWFGQIVSETSSTDLLTHITMNDCTTIGSVSGTYGVGGFVGQLSAGKLTMNNCINHASVTGSSSYCGGFLGNSGASNYGTHFNGCKNYGAVTCNGTSYSSRAGGIVGRLSHKTANDYGLVTFADCVNYGAITSKSSAGGILGRAHENDDEYNLAYKFYNCLNVGTVSGQKFAGGMTAATSPILYKLSFINCANVGKVISSSGYAGNIAGVLSNSTLENCYAAGVISAPSGKGGVWGGLTTGRFSSDGDGSGYINEPITNNCYDLSTDVNAEALANMQALYGTSFVQADASDRADALLVIADPQLRGIQQSVNTSNGVCSVRFNAIINALDAYETVGFRMSVYINGQKLDVDRTTGSVYTSLNVTKADGSSHTISASSLSGKYFYTMVLTNVPTNQNVVIEVTPYATNYDGTEYTGKTRVVTSINGVYHLEPMLLNGVSLEKYSIVYPANGSHAEKLLAERLANKIAAITGQVIPVYSDTAAERANEILVGTTNRHTPEVAGRWIYRYDFANKTSLQLTATGTTALSEVVQYFIDTLDQRVQTGNSAWHINPGVQVPVDEAVSVMSFNLGAKDNSYIKAAEWDLIVDYLPDLMTLQEPWAGFLDDFLNNYAVQPTTKFQASASDDDVMVTDVDNKAFTGKGYYGVYWGLPRWVPGDAHMTGKASYSVILYAKDRFTVDEGNSGTFWFSYTPDVSSSMLSGCSHTRCATYATMTDLNTNERFVLVNVHLDTESGVQAEQIRILLDELANRVDSSLPILITGDMNTRLPTISENAATSSYPIGEFFAASWNALAFEADVQQTYEASTSSPFIDWIFTNKDSNTVHCTFYKMCFDRNFYNNLWASGLGYHFGLPSDHPAVYAEMTINTGATRPSVPDEDVPGCDHNYGDWVYNANTQKHSRTCDKCGTVKTKACSWNAGEITTPATHTSTGVKTYTCTVCHGTKTETIAKDPTHSFGEWQNLVNGDGKHSHTCACGASEQQGCAWNAGQTITEATHFVEGEILYTCTVCGDTKIEKTDKVGEHAWSEWIYNPATGKHSRSCACEAIETAACSWNDGVITTPATHTSTGVKTYTCTVCHGTKTEVIPQIAHQFGAWTPTEDADEGHYHECECGEKEFADDCDWDSGVQTLAPTVTTEGERTYTCTTCGRTKTETIPKVEINIGVVVDPDVENDLGLEWGPIHWLG